MADLRDAIVALERLVAATSGVVDEAIRQEAAAVAERARNRRGFLGDSVLVALVGGTGSGKSSLLNAVADDQVAEAGSRRPMTTEPQAWIPKNPEPRLLGLLDELGIMVRTGHDQELAIALIDLPDIDSVEAGHRAIVDGLLPQVDAIVWVMDPEKYQDRVLHTEHIQPMAEHHHRFLFVLNQIDRVATGELDAMVADLRRRLQSEGIPAPVILTTAADPPAGPPYGIEGFLDAISALGTAKQLVYSRTIVDIKTTADRLAARAGLGEHLGDSLEEMWLGECDEVARILVAAGLGSRLRHEAVRSGSARGRGAVAFSTPAKPAEIAISPDWGLTAVGGAASELSAFIERLRPTVPGQTTIELETVSRSLKDELQAALEYSVSGSVYRLPGLPKSLTVLRGMRWGAALLVFVSLAWVVAMWPDGVLVPATVGGLSVLWVLASPRIGEWIGRQWARAELDLLKRNLTVVLSREIDRRIGRSLRTALRRHQMATGALGELRQVMTALRTDDVS